MLNADLEEIWRLDIGEQIAASVGISSDGRELYVVTRGPILKVIDHGDRGEIALPLAMGAPVHPELIIRDAACAAVDRIASTPRNPRALEEERRRFSVLLRQTGMALSAVASEGRHSGAQLGRLAAAVQKVARPIAAEGADPDSQAWQRLCELSDRWASRVAAP